MNASFFFYNKKLKIARPNRDELDVSKPNPIQIVWLQLDTTPMRDHSTFVDCKQEKKNWFLLLNVVNLSFDAISAISRKLSPIVLWQNTNDALDSVFNKNFSIAFGRKMR